MDPGQLPTSTRTASYFYQDSSVGFKVTAETLGDNLMPLRFNPQGPIDINGTSFAYGVDGSQRFTSAIQGSPCPLFFCQGLSTSSKSIVYDSVGRASSITDFVGTTTLRTYDQARDVLLSQTEASGQPEQRVTTYTWDSRFRRPTTITEPIRVAGVDGTRTTTLVYDDRAHPLTVTVAPSSGEPSRTTTFTYDTQGLLATETSPSGAVSSFVHDAQGHLTSWTDAADHTSTVDAYTVDGLPGRVTDPNGLQTVYTYDVMGRLTQVQRGTPDTHWETSQIVYQPSGTGLIDHLVLPDGRQVVFTYNSAQWLTGVSQKDSQGNTLGSVVYTYTVMGDLQAEQWLDAQGQPIATGTHTYDTFHRLANDLGSASQTTTLTYDAQGRPLTVKDPNGNITKRAYDALSRVTQVTDALNHTATLAYDPQDAVVQATDFMGHATTYGYNGFGDQISRSSPDSGTWTFQVDGAGRRTGVTDARGATTTITYDRLDRPTQVVHDSTQVPASQPGVVRQTSTETFTYDTCTHGVGQLCATTDPSGTTAYTYDVFGRVIETAFTPATTSLTLTTGYAYDTSGRLVGVTYPSGRTLARAYGSDGELSSLTWDGTPLLAQVTHQPVSGAVTGWQWHSIPAGGVSFGYDLDHQLTQLADNSAQGTSRTLGYDPGGRLTSVTVNGASAWNQLYGYDKADRLTSATLPGYPGGLTYAYDFNGNRTAHTNDGTTFAYTYGLANNRLLGLTATGGLSATVAYDANGNIVDDGQGLLFSYDAQNRLAQASGGSGVTYAYNAHGQRVFKQVIGGPLNGVERYVYGPGGVLLGVYRADGSVVEETAYLDDGRPVGLARQDANGWTVYPILTDHLGTPRQVLDPATGAPLWTWEAKEPFGAERPNETVSGTRFVYRGRFPGQVFDEDTGLVHNGFRDYLASVGRYAQSDPIGLGGGWNTYGYVAGNPAISTDDSGLLLKMAFSKAISFANRSVYRSQTDLAISYLSEVPSMVKKISQIEDANYTVTIILTDDPSIKNLRASEDGDGNFIIPWNPYLSPEFYNSESRKRGFVSPALALGHELDHTSCERTGNVTLGFNRSLNQVRSLLGMNNPYDDMEEERVITGSEHENALHHHEFIRNNHGFLIGKDGLPVVKNVQNSISH